MDITEKTKAILILLSKEFLSAFKRPLVIISAARCLNENKKAGGVANSSHTLGKAVDVQTTISAERFFVVKFLIENKVSRIGIGRSFVHFDTADKTLPKNVIWLY